MFNYCVVLAFESLNVMSLLYVRIKLLFSLVLLIGCIVMCWKYNFINANLRTNIVNTECRWSAFIPMNYVVYLNHF